MWNESCHLFNASSRIEWVMSQISVSHDVTHKRVKSRACVCACVRVCVQVHAHMRSLFLNMGFWSMFGVYMYVCMRGRACVCVYGSVVVVCVDARIGLFQMSTYLFQVSTYLFCMHTGLLIR